MDYEEFLKKQQFEPVSAGFDPDLSEYPLFDFQHDVTRWACMRGRAATFLDTGLGKTIIQLSWANEVAKRYGPVLVLAPLAVADQTIREGERFGITVAKALQDNQAPIQIANYEQLKNIDTSIYSGVVLDESSILKNYDGTTRQQIQRAFNETPFRLSCTATPSPNDLMEFGTQAEFLGIMSYNEMLSMFFIHDSGETQQWRLKGHGRTRFWEWLSTWAVFMRNPKDYGYTAEGYDLPPVRYHEHVVESGLKDGLLPFIAQTLEERRKARKASVDARVAEAAKVANNLPKDEPVIIWCHLNDESDKLSRAIDGAVEVRGSDKSEHKAWALTGFADGRVNRLVSKPSIAGFGMNWQRCANVIFVGLSDCYDEKTEILTDRGWLKFCDVTYSDSVASINRDYLSVEWQKPESIIWKDYKGEMIKIQGNESFDLLVTPGHSLFAQKCPIRYSRTDGWQVMEAQWMKENYMRQKFRMKSTPQDYCGENPDYISIPQIARESTRSRSCQYINSKDFIELAGWYISEGYCRPIDSYEAGRIVICQTNNNPKNRQNIINLMRRIGLNVNSRTKDITGYSKNLAAFLIDNFGSSSRNKFIPSWVKRLDSSLLVVLRDTMIKGDGNFRGTHYKSFSPQLRDDFQEICLFTGIRASVKSDYVSLAWKQTEPSIFKEPERVYYEGKIGCVSVPNGLLLIRRNGIPLISGNSFESYYQAIRRCWRFGQEREVNVHIVSADSEGAVVENIKRKEQQHEEIAEEMIDRVKDLTMASLGKAKADKTEYHAQQSMELPQWM